MHEKINNIVLFTIQRAVTDALGENAKIPKLHQMALSFARETVTTLRTEERRKVHN